MIQVYRYDENYIFIEPVIVEEDGNGNYVIPENCTDVEPVSFYKAKFDINKKEWYESASQEYIDSLQPPPPEPSEVVVLAEKVANLYYLVAMGG
ncbi:hypothetical protein UJ203_10090 [Bacillus sp. V26]|uniref:hypothetical protein n=1 Tax=Bacillus sp. V26 TaxID=3098288 RepID=UPI002AAD30EA|nr:hypothetical protein [Bacillus sp. V26]MDY7432058.1 hypothetical protein [Bacillus sp. V26]